MALKIKYLRGFFIINFYLRRITLLSFVGLVVRNVFSMGLRSRLSTFLPSANVTNIFGRWLNGIDKNTKTRVRKGVCIILLDNLKLS